VLFLAVCCRRSPPYAWHWTPVWGALTSSMVAAITLCCGRSLRTWGAGPRWLCESNLQPVARCRDGHSVLGDDVEQWRAMLTVITGLLSGASYALSDMLAQRGTRAIGPLCVALWVMLTGMVVVLPVALIVNGLPSGSEEWLGFAYACGAGVLYVGAYGCLLMGLRRGDLSLVATLFALQGLFTALIAIAGGEQVTPLLVLGLALAIVGGALAAMRERARTAKGAGWALLSGLLASCIMLLYDRADALPWLSQTAFSRMATVLVLLPVAAPLVRGKLTPEVRPIVIGAGLLEVAGVAFVTISVQLGPLSVAGVSSAQIATIRRDPRLGGSERTSSEAPARRRRMHSYRREPLGLGCLSRGCILSPLAGMVSDLSVLSLTPGRLVEADAQ